MHIDNKKMNAFLHLYNDTKRCTATEASRLSDLFCETIQHHIERCASEIIKESLLVK